MTSVEVRSAQIEVKYSEVYDTAPSLPRPLRSKYELKHITKEGFLEEALTVAPLTPEEIAKLEALGLHDARSLPTDGNITRHIKRNLIYQHKAQEFALVHQEFYRWYNRVIEVIDMIQAGCSLLMTIALYIPFKEIRTVVDTCVAIGTLVLAVLKSFVVISGYEKLAAKHRNAARGFDEVVEQVESMFTALVDIKEVSRDELKAAMASAAAGDPKSSVADATAQINDATAQINDAAAQFKDAQGQATAGAAQAQDAVAAAQEAAATAKEAAAQAQAQAQEAAAQAQEAAAKAKQGWAQFNKLRKMKPTEVIKLLQSKAMSAICRGLDINHEEEETEGILPPDAIKRLRLMYRKALEFRVAHSLYESFYLKCDRLFSITHLVLSSLVSGVLFLKDPIEDAGLPAKELSLALTTTLSALNFTIGFMQLPKQAVTHTIARLAFASLQRSFATTLMIQRPDDIAKRFHEYAAQWNETLANTFVLTPVHLQCLRDDSRRKLLLPLITPPIMSKKDLRAAVKAKQEEYKAAAEARAATLQASAEAQAATLQAAGEAQAATLVSSSQQAAAGGLVAKV